MKIQFLRIKLKALAAEARIIRREERRTFNRFGNCTEPELHAAMRNHRVVVVRRAARHTQLAYGFLRGRSYTAIEGHSTCSAPDWAEVLRMVRKYGAADTTEEGLRDWYGKVERAPVKKVA